MGKARSGGSYIIHPIENYYSDTNSNTLKVVITRPFYKSLKQEILRIREH